MNEHIEGQAVGLPAVRRYLPFLIVLFAASGCAALIYEIVWFQLLELVIGSSAISLGVLLATFMGGMCLGSLLMPHFIDRSNHPLRVYALLELGIGAIGLVLLFAMPLIGGIYTAWGGPGSFGMFFRAMIAVVCLLPPTFLMGATLPAISRWVETTPEGVSWLGFFYGGNVGGGVIGSLLTAFYLLRVHDVSFATYVAVALNLAVAGLSLTVARSTPYVAKRSDEGSPIAAAGSGNWVVYLAIAFSGLTALAAEVIWTRLLSLLFGPTVYAFALILAVFLFGLGIGSSIGSGMARHVKNPRAALGWCQLLLCVAMAWSAYELMQSLPLWPIEVTMASNSFWIKAQMDTVRAVWAILPGAILWGASFPLALASLVSFGKDPGRLVGGVYAANTVGAIAGSIGASFFLVSMIGSQHAHQLLIAVSGVSALLLLAMPASRGQDEGKSDFYFAISVLSVAAICGIMIFSVPELSRDFVAFGRFLPARGGQGEVIYMGEGVTASVAVSRMSNGVLNYHNAGKVQASSEPADMPLQRMLGHLTTLIPTNPRKFLVIGYGAGLTAGAVSIEPQMDSETIVEIEPLVPKVVSTYFSEYNFDLAHNPKVHVQIDDGRHFVLTSREKFDGITSDPLDPWVKGAASLYTREFFESAKAHLNPGGVMTQFIQFYESNEDAVRSEIATFMDVFPHGIVFANTIQGKGYDVVAVGQADDMPIDIDRMQQRLDSPEYARIAQSLREIGFYSAVSLLGTYAGQGADLQPWLKNAQINRDRNLRLQYLAGLSLNQNKANDIYQKMVAYGPRMPAALFKGSEARLDLLSRTILAGPVH